MAHRLVTAAAVIHCAWSLTPTVRPAVHQFALLNFPAFSTPRW